MFESLNHAKLYNTYLTRVEVVELYFGHVSGRSLEWQND